MTDVNNFIVDNNFIYRWFIPSFFYYIYAIIVMVEIQYAII